MSATAEAPTSRLSIGVLRNTRFHICPIIVNALRSQPLGLCHRACTIPPPERRSCSQHRVRMQLHACQSTLRKPEAPGLEHYLKIGPLVNVQRNWSEQSTPGHQASAITCLPTTELGLRGKARLGNEHFLNTRDPKVRHGILHEAQVLLNHFIRPEGPLI